MSAILSLVMCDKLVTLMGKQEMDVIIYRFINSKSHSISLDFTPNVDQLTLILGPPPKQCPWPQICRSGTDHPQYWHGGWRHDKRLVKIERL